MMSGFDYRSCAVCGGKAFYDAEIDDPAYVATWDDEEDADPIGIAVLCSECNKTHEVVVQRRGVNNKPSWENAPEWANWLAQDSEGEWCWFELKPKPKYWLWGAGGLNEYAESLFVPKTNEDWRETLEQRPAINRPAVKPVWSDAPGWAQWLAQDADGSWWWYEFRPELDLDADGCSWLWQQSQDRRKSASVMAGVTKVIGKGHETLEARP